VLAMLKRAGTAALFEIRRMFNIASVTTMRASRTRSQQPFSQFAHVLHAADAGVLRW
jgi:uncharacterized protein YbcV (DUF1398 family)